MKALTFLLLLISSVCHAGYIDNHVHVACFGYQSNCYISQEMRESYKFPIYQKMFGVKEEEAKKRGDSIIIHRTHLKIKKSQYVDKAVILAIDQVYNSDGTINKKKTQIYVPNHFVQSGTSKYDTLLFGASVHPYRKDALKELEKVKKQGAVLIKLIPSIQIFNPMDQKLIPYYKKLVQLNLPLLIHMDNESSFAYEEKKFSGPEKLEVPLKLGVKVICAHAATNGESQKGEDYFEVLSRLSLKYPNLYADISALLVFKTRYAHIKKVIHDKRWKGKLIYGSDWPLSHGLLSSPLYYIFHIGPFTALKLSFTSNHWDRDVLMKKAFGAQEEIFKATEKLLFP